jgi:hypothetical protein
MIGGKTTPDDLIELALSGEAGWCEPELLRLKGEKLLDRRDVTGRQSIIDGFELASRQSALTWQLRCANSLAAYAIPQSLDIDRIRIDRTLRMFSGDPPRNDLLKSTRLLDGSGLAQVAEITT